MSKLVKTLGKEIDKVTRKLDANTSKAIGMPEGVKISHAADRDSAKHKQAVAEIKGKESSPSVRKQA